MIRNRILVDIDRKLLQDRIELMFKYAPDMMSRKITEANVQQAFILDTVLELSGKDASILCVGSFEDTVMETLVKLGYDVFGIDPTINFSLEQYFIDTSKKYDIIFATSVIEHVEDDERFLSCICDMLKSNGLGIITCDFNNEYVPGAPVPATVVKQYTKYDLEDRLPRILRDYKCSLYGQYDWNAKPDFIYQGHLYSFATFVFQRD
jgi:SAM-dependent methyltransferase